MYMDSKTFRLYNYLEEMEYPERVIEIDEMIAPTVSLLNKKKDILHMQHVLDIWKYIVKMEKIIFLVIIQNYILHLSAIC